MEYSEIFTILEEAKTKTDIKIGLVALLDKKLKEKEIETPEDEGVIARLRAKIVIEL